MGLYFPEIRRSLDNVSPGNKLPHDKCISPTRYQSSRNSLHVILVKTLFFRQLTLVVPIALALSTYLDRLNMKQSLETLRQTQLLYLVCLVFPHGSNERAIKIDNVWETWVRVGARAELSYFLFLTFFPKMR